MFIHMQRNENHKALKWNDFALFYKQWIDGIDDDAIAKVFTRADVDRSGTIDLHEFIRVFMNEHYFKYNLDRKYEVERQMKQRTKKMGDVLNTRTDLNVSHLKQMESVDINMDGSKNMEDNDGNQNSNGKEGGNDVQEGGENQDNAQNDVQEGGENQDNAQNAD